MHNSDYPKEYRLRIYWLLIAFWVGGCLAVVQLIISIINTITKTPELFFLAFLLPIYIYLLIFLFHMVQDFRLKISKSGIELILWSRTIYADWAQVKRIGNSFFQRQLVLEKPNVEKRNAWWLLLDAHKLRSNDSLKSIPFSKMMWKNFEEIEAEVRKHAPYVFD